MISREELMAAEQAFLASSKLPSLMDLSELPEHDSWDVWIYSVPLDGTDSDLDTMLGRLDSWQAEVSRRENLVKYARSLASWREHAGVGQGVQQALDRVKRCRHAVHRAPHGRDLLCPSHRGSDRQVNGHRASRGMVGICG